MTVTFAGLGDERFVSLTTFRPSGERVSTPVWVGRQGGALVVTAPVDSGKVKRLRNDPRVELRPCNRRGTVRDGDAPVTGIARLMSGGEEAERSAAVIRDKYGLEYWVAMAVEGVLKRGARQRVIIRIASPSDS